MGQEPRHYWPKSRTGDGTCSTLFGVPPLRRRAGPTRIRRTSTEFPSTALGEAEKPARSEAEGVARTFAGCICNKTIRRDEFCQHPPDHWRPEKPGVGTCSTGSAASSLYAE